MAELDVLFNPESIAVVGASRTPGKIGYEILHSLKKSFKKKIYAINPNPGKIMDLTAFSSVLSVEEPIDLAVIAVKAEIVNNILLECKKKKIKAAIIISSGFSEIGEKERELSLLKSGKGIRILGPNCIGVYDTHNHIDTLFMPYDRLKRPLEGSISFITQSGAFGSVMLDLIAHEGVGVSKFISIGNRVDIDEIELLKYLGNDPNTRAIAIYMESTKNGTLFLEAAKKIVKKKPVVALKAGKTQKGTEAVASHTGSLAGSYSVYSSVFKQAGIIEAKTTEELFDYSKALATQPSLSSNKIAIVTDGGGFGIVATDAAIESGLELAQLSNNSVKSLKSFLPPYASTANPIDLTGDSDSERYGKALQTVFKDKGIGGVVVIALTQITTMDEKIVDVLRDCKVYGKPFVVCMAGSEYTLKLARKLEGYGVPVYQTPERAVKSLAALHSYAEILKRKA